MEKLEKRLTQLNFLHTILTIVVILFSFLGIMKTISAPFNIIVCIMLHIFIVIIATKLNQYFKHKLLKPYIDKIPTVEFNDYLLERNYFAMDRPERIEIMQTLASRYNTNLEVLLYKLQEIKKQM